MSSGADTTEMIGSDAHGYHEHVLVRRARRAVPYAIAGAIAAVVAAGATRAWIVSHDTYADGSHPPFRLAIVAVALVIGLAFGELMGIALGRAGARATATRALSERRQAHPPADRRAHGGAPDAVRHRDDLSHVGLGDRPAAEMHAMRPPSAHALGDNRTTLEPLTRLVERVGVARRGVLCVVSVDDADTAALVAAGVGTSAWLRGIRVVLADLAARSPQLHATYGLHRSPGVREVLAGELLDLALLPRDDGPHVLTGGSGDAPIEPAAIEPLIGQLRARYAVVGVCIRLDDRAAATAGLADACLVAVRVGTSGERLRAAVASLETAGVPVDGIVLVGPERRTNQRRQGAGAGLDEAHGST